MAVGDSAENSGTFSTFILTLCTECLIRNYVSRVQKHSLPNYNITWPIVSKPSPVMDNVAIDGWGLLDIHYTKKVKDIKYPQLFCVVHICLCKNVII